VGVKHLLDRRRLLLWIDVPDLKLTSKSANEEMILVDLVQESRVLFVIDRSDDFFGACLDVDVADQHLLVVEARDSQHR